MTDIKITYESLYDVLRKEKNLDELQKIDENFFKDVTEYINTKKEILNSQESKESIFTHSEAQKTKKQIEQIQIILKELWERREHKILQLALFSSRTNTETKNINLLDEEISLYSDIKNNLTLHREEMFKRLIEGKTEELVKPKALKTKEDNERLKLIRILQPIPKFVGEDLHIYGPFEANDIASLSGKIADLLIEKNKAEIMKNENLQTD